MASNVNNTVPADNSLMESANLRTNFEIIKTELESLQTTYSDTNIAHILAGIYCASINNGAR